MLHVLHVLHECCMFCMFCMNVACFACSAWMLHALHVLHECCMFCMNVACFAWMLHVLHECCMLCMFCMNVAWMSLINLLMMMMSLEAQSLMPSAPSEGASEAQDLSFLLAACLGARRGTCEHNPGQTFCGLPGSSLCADYFLLACPGGRHPCNCRTRILCTWAWNVFATAALSKYAWKKKKSTSFQCVPFSPATGLLAFSAPQSVRY